MNPPDASPPDSAPTIASPASDAATQPPPRSRRRESSDGDVPSRLREIDDDVSAVRERIGALEARQTAEEANNATRHTEVMGALGTLSGRVDKLSDHSDGPSWTGKVIYALIGTVAVAMIVVAALGGKLISLQYAGASITTGTTTTATVTTETHVPRTPPPPDTDEPAPAVVVPPRSPQK